MSDLINEYLPNNGTNGNGTNGHKKIFNLVPVEDDIGQQIKSVRTDALRDRQLSDGARMLLCQVLDLAVSRDTMKRFGSVIISTTKLCEILGRSARAIYGWKKQLVRGHYVWISKVPMPNFWPMDHLHITRLDAPDKTMQMPTKDGLWGNGARREQAERGQGGRQPGQLALSSQSTLKNPLRGTKQHRSQTHDSSFPEQNATGHGTKGHLSAANIAVESGKDCCGPQQKMLCPTAELAVESGKKQHRGTAQNDTGAQQQPAHIKKSIVKSIETSRARGVVSPPSNRDEWKKKLAKMFRRELKELKSELLNQQRRLEPGDPEIADLSCRIEDVDVALYGAKVPASKAALPPGKPARKAPEPKQPTEQEILDGAQYLVEIGKTDLLTKTQKAALARANK